MPKLVLNLGDARPIWSVTDAALEEIRAAASPHFEVVIVRSAADGRGDGGAPSAEAIEAIAGAEVYVGFGFPKALFQAATASGERLRWVHSASAGVGGALYPEMRDSGILLTNSAGVHAEPMAETVLAAIHYFARGFDVAVAAQRERRWANDAFSALATPVRELAGSTVGIIGLGGIGRAVARRAGLLGMRVLGLNRSGRTVGPDVEVVSGEAGLDRLLRESHFVVLALPRTGETENLMSRERIAGLRSDAVLVNVGRGELIDEAALAKALAAGRIRGAALDVFREEPLPSDSPLWGLPNVLITPHASATTDRFWGREVALIVENLARYRRGEPMLNQVDKRAGY